MELDKTKLNSDRGFLEGLAPEAVDPATAQLVTDYKANVCKNYISLNPEQVDSRLGGTSFYVTRKYDGELAVLFWTGEDLFTINTGGRVRMGIPCYDEAKAALQKAGVKQAVIPSELYVDETNGRGRVFEVLQALAEPERHGNLRLAPFDLISLNGEPFKAASYGDTHGKLVELFGGTKACVPVRCQAAGSKGAVMDLYGKWVEEEGAEGLVVRSELPLIYKVKPRYNLDVAVVGFSEGVAECRGQVRSLLLALMPEEGVYQLIGKTGNGFGEELKKELFETLTPMVMESKYVETDSNHVAFHMVKPGMVIELNINDVLFESTSGPIMNTRLEIIDGEYRSTGSVPGISVVFPIFSRMRDDKGANATDVRLTQIAEFAYAPAGEPVASVARGGRSELLKREVYKKEQGQKLMVQKFLAWKTNKEETGSYPAYVLHYVNFSSERKDPLQSEVRVSSSQQQILALFDQLLEKNIKKGWVKAEA